VFCSCCVVLQKFSSSEHSHDGMYVPSDSLPVLHLVESAERPGFAVPAVDILAVVTAVV